MPIYHDGFLAQQTNDERNFMRFSEVFVGIWVDFTEYVLWTADLVHHSGYTHDWYTIDLLSLLGKRRCYILSRNVDSRNEEE